ncbi:MAG: amino acid adenylation domain-containing protein [Verrucomicrobiia bacterium]
MTPNGHSLEARSLPVLSDDKRRLLDQRLRRSSAPAASDPKGILPRPAGTKALASPGQARMWVLSDLDANSPSHNVISSFEIQGSLDRSALRFALNAVVDRHQILRSGYRLEEGEIVQVVVPRVDLEIEEGKAWTRREMLDFAEAFARKRFDLQSGPLLRLGLFSSGDTGLLVLAVHDIAFDKWSQLIFWREFSAFYRQAKGGVRADLPELPIQYSDFSYWQREFLKSGEQERQIAYWRRKLQNPPPPIPLPTDWPYPAKIGDQGGLAHSRLPASVVRQLRQISADLDASLFVTLATGFAILLGRYAEMGDVIVSSPVANRRRQETASLIGFFLNTLVIRHDFSDDPTCLEGIGRARTAALEALDHQDLPTDKIVEAVRPDRVQGRHPLFQAMFVFQNEDERGAKPELGNCTVTSIYVDTKTAKFDLSLFVAESQGELETILEYRSDLFRPESARRFLEHYSALMTRMAANPRQRFSEISFLTAAEEEFFTRHENGPSLAVPEDTTMLNLISRHTSRSSAAVASSDQVITYQELHALSNNVAAVVRERGPEANRPVALAFERSPYAIVALLGILKAGAPYLALDISAPPERTREILGDAACRCLITSGSMADRFRFPNVQALRVEDAMANGAHTGGGCPRAIAQQDNAYLIYTSGSSGKPKGVAVTHGNLLASTLARIGFYADAPRNFLLLPNLSFDSSVAGVFWTLATGGALIVPTTEEVTDPDRIGALISQYQTDALLAVPSLYDQLLGWQPERLSSLRTVIVAGEACPARLVRKHFDALPSCQLYNEYGPTEATVWASVHRCDSPQASSREVPIGKPIPGCEIRILDAQRQRRPVGFVGELCIGGIGLTSGYLGRPELTAQRFFRADDGTRLYASGDLARWLPDGTLEFHGRNDQQIKIRGHRVEIGEIESCVRELPGVREAVAVAVSSNSTASPDSLSLETLVSLLPEDTLERALADLAIEENEAEPTAPCGDEPSPPVCQRKVDRAAFEVRFTFKSPGFIAPPRKAQRDWLVGQAINETADDLEHLDRVARGFVPGKDHQLQRDLVDFSDAPLTDAQIMEDWQIPLMRAMAGYAAESPGDVLEVGFGRGVSATFIQQRRPRSHTIIEMNRHCIQQHFEPWRQRYSEADVRVCAGRWQDVLPDLGLFDAILFHTYPMNEEEFMEYVLSSITFAEHAFEPMAHHLKPGGIFTYLTAEIDSLSRRHQRALLKHFSEISFTVVPLSVPPDTIDSWWANSMVAVKAVK